MNGTFSLSRRLALIALIPWLLLCIPFPATSFLAACVACVLFPWYRQLVNNAGKTRAILQYTCFVTLSVALPIAIVVMLVTPQATKGLHILAHVTDSDLFSLPEIQASLTVVDGWLKGLPGIEGGLRQVADQLGGLVQGVVSTVITHGIGLAGSALNALFIICIFIMISILCVNCGDTIHVFSKRLLGFSDDLVDHFTTAIRNAARGVLLGIVLVAMLQGVLCGIGFSVAGVPQAAFWGLLAAFVAPIPFVGTALVWVPAVIWVWATMSHGMAVGLLLWCVLAVTGVDNVLRPLFLKSGINASFITLVLAILLGMTAFGPIGIFAGPVIVAVAIQAAHESHRHDEIPE